MMGQTNVEKSTPKLGEDCCCYGGKTNPTPSSDLDWCLSKMFSHVCNLDSVVVKSRSNHNKPGFLWIFHMIT